MRKIVVRFLMLLFVLGMSTNAMWAGSDILEMAQQAKENDLLTEEQIAALTEMPYRATLTGRTSSTGGGKVYVTTEGGDPTTEEYVEGVSNVATNGFPISMPGMDEMKVYIYAHAKPLDGYYFVGWSGSDGGTDLISDSVYDSDLEKMVMPTKQYIKRYDVATQPNDTAYYVIYGTFDPIRIADYAISGDYTTKDGTGKKYSDFQVIFTLSGAAEDIDASDFKDPSVSGTGWSIANWDYNTTNTGKVTVNVHFETINTDPAEYSGKLTLETKADISMKVDLHTRTAASSDIEAVRYNKNKAKVGEGDLTAMIDAAEPTDVIKLNKDYDGQVVATKSFTLDLNGYNITHSYSDIVADYSTTEGQTNPTRIAQAAILVNDADAVVTLAYSPYGGKIIAGPYNDAIDVLAGKLVLNGGTLVGFFGVGSMGEVVQNGATIVGGSGCAVASMGGMLTMTDGKIYGELGTMGETSELIINGGSIDATSQTIEGVTLPSDYPGVQVGGGTAWIKKGTIKGGSYGVQNVGGSITIEKLAIITGGSYALDFNSGLTTINCGKFEDPTTMCDLSTIESKIAGGNAALVSCYLKTNSPGASNYWGIPVWRNTSGAEYREGYEFFVGPSDAAKAAGVSVCHIGGTSYSSLEDALAYANTTSDSIAIVMDNDYILPAGYYTLPGHATLIIPMNSEQGSACQLVTKVPGKANDYVQPFKYRKLTFSNGVNFDVHGLLEVGGSQFAGETRYSGSPIGSYGQLQMNKGSRMILQNGSELRAWGYITGDIANKNAQYDVPMGEIDARRGSLVHEQFQMGDWGSDILSAAMGLLTHAESTFPISDYFIQNIEVPVKYHPGARLSAATSVYADASAGNMQLRALMSADDIKIVGVNEQDTAMFLLDANADAENTWVRKWYDASKDQQVYEINSGAYIGQLIIPLISSPLFKDAQDLMAMMEGTVGTIGSILASNDIHFPEELTMNSGQYFLPITTNFKLHLLSGKMDFTQSTELLPGSELEIDKESTVTVTKNGAEGVREGSLYIYDIEDWGDKNSYLVKYSPVFEGEPTTRDVNDLPSASVNVHGTFDTNQGYVFTTEHGGNIYSSVEDAGTFTFTEAAKDADYYEEITQYGGQNARCYSAFLRNSDEYVESKGGDESHRYVHTGGTEEDMSYCYLDIDGQGGRWMALKQRGCFTYDEASGTYFIKPQEYVAVVATNDGNGNIVGNADHTFSDAAGAGRLFIQLTDETGYDCQWWEVEQKDNLYHCIHPLNDTYYYWNELKYIVKKYNKETHTFVNDTIPGWSEKKFEITWLNWDGEPIVDANDEPIVYEVTYGTQAEWLSTNPTREKNLDYTYDFTGWSPALGKVTSDITYTATYEEKQIKYTVVFVQDGGVEIERHLLARNEMPVCENLPTRTGYILEWSPALAAVIGNQTYTATWLPEPPTKYEITFYDYNGSTILKQGDVNVGDMPVPPAQVSGKQATSEYTYVFDHWSPAVEKVSTTSIKSYTAVYREEARTYTISYYKEDGTTLNTSEQLPYGATPTPPAVTKENPATGHTYTLVWKTVDETGGIQTVMGDASYKPTYLDALNKYTVTVKSNPSGACSITGAGLYDYNSSATITLAVNTGYTFTGWSDSQEGTNTSRSITVTEDKELVANFNVAEPDYTITWKSEDGLSTYATVGQKSGTATIYTGPTPAKASTDQYSYTFYGWTTRDNEGNILNTYKNGMTPKATKNETYYACFTPVIRQYNVALSSNIANVCMLVGAGTYDYSASAENATVIVSGYDAVNYTFDGWYNGEDQVSEAESYSFAVQSDVDLVAKFSPVTYTVTWKSENGVSTLETDADQAYGAATAYNSAEPTKENYSFIGWTTAANGEGSFYAKGATPAVSGNATYYAYFAANSTSLNIAADGIETLTEATDYTTFTITSNGVTSGQLINANYLSLLGEAIFKLQPASAIPGRTWYAVAAPWMVDVRTGIYANGNHLNVGVDFDIIEFNAESYAVNEAGTGNTNVWRYVEENGGVMQPGKLYLIYLASAKSSLEFHKTGGGISTTTLSLTTTSGSGDKANWNAIANPALYHANIDAGVEDYEVYNSNNGSYTVKTDLSTTDLIVGQPIFVQVTTPQPNVSADVASGGAPAPYRRAPQAQTADNRFVVEIARNGQMNDRLIVQTADEKENTYVIGQDLAKMGVGSKTAQMWMNRYNTKLCKNTVEMDNNAEYPLSIYAPAAGEYTLSAMQKRGDADLYLTLNGETIWNLSDADYTLNLNKGTAANYGLRISVKKTPTGIDEAVVDAKGEIRKVLINDKVFIIRGDKVYTIDGQMVK